MLFKDLLREHYKGISEEELSLKISNIRAARYGPKNILKSYSVSGGKGGIGKTTVATNLGVESAKHGKKAVLFDCDHGGPDDFGRNRGLLVVDGSFDLDAIVELGKTDKQAAIKEFEKIKPLLTPNAFNFIVGSYGSGVLTELDLPTIVGYKDYVLNKDKFEYSLSIEDLFIRTIVPNYNLVFGIIDDEGQHVLARAPEDLIRQIFSDLTNSFDGKVIYDLPPGSKDLMALDLFVKSDRRLLVPTFSDQAASDEVITYLKSAFVRYIELEISDLKKGIKENGAKLKSIEKEEISIRKSISNNLELETGLIGQSADFIKKLLEDEPISTDVKNGHFKLIEKYSRLGELISEKHKLNQQKAYLSFLKSDEKLFSELENDVTHLANIYGKYSFSIKLKPFIEKYRCNEKTKALIENYIQTFSATTFLLLNRTPPGDYLKAGNVFRSIKEDVADKILIRLSPAGLGYIFDDPEFFNEATQKDIPVSQLGVSIPYLMGNRPRVMGQIKYLAENFLDLERKGEKK